MPAPASPRIWLDSEATNVAKLAARSLASGSELTVIRWENGFVEGWVQFDGDDSPERTQLDVQRQLVKQIADKEGGRVPAAVRLSGMAIVSTSKVVGTGVDGGEHEWFECKIIIQTTWTEEDGGEKSTNSIAMGPIIGRVKLARGQISKSPPPEGGDMFAAREGEQSFINGQKERTTYRFWKKSRMSLEGPLWMQLKVIAPGN